ncbi:MAG: methyltransferase domain-containing protein [Candidatus Pacebacteria bacterium]|nr:methyltransferase domain-containing protein [Candidatus Paceibacterota bacterium]
MNKFADLMKETMKGKSLYRILFNWKVSEICVGQTGVCLELASGKKPASYYRYWKINSQEIIRVDINPEAKPDIIADLNETLPFSDDYADNVFLFNSLYLLNKPEEFVGEVFRVLKKGGRFFITAEFIKSEETNANDIGRFTSRRLRRIFNAAGFSKIEIVPVGERFSAVGNFFDFTFGHSAVANFFKIFLRLFFLALDVLMPKKVMVNYPCPISWIVIGEK